MSGAPAPAGVESLSILAKAPNPSYRKTLLHVSAVGVFEKRSEGGTTHPELHRTRHTLGVFDVRGGLDLATESPQRVLRWLYRAGARAPSCTANHGQVLTTATLAAPMKRALISLLLGAASARRQLFQVRLAALHAPTPNHRPTKPANQPPSAHTPRRAHRRTCTTASTASTPSTPPARRSSSLARTTSTSASSSTSRAFPRRRCRSTWSRSLWACTPTSRCASSSRTPPRVRVAPPAHHTRSSASPRAAPRRLRPPSHLTPRPSTTLSDHRRRHGWRPDDARHARARDGDARAAGGAHGRAAAARAQAHAALRRDAPQERDGLAQPDDGAAQAPRAPAAAVGRAGGGVHAGAPRQVRGGRGVARAPQLHALAAARRRRGGRRPAGGGAALARRRARRRPAARGAGGGALGGAAPRVPRDEPAGRADRAGGLHRARRHRHRHSADADLGHGHPRRGGDHRLRRLRPRHVRGAPPVLFPPPPAIPFHPARCL